MAKSITLSVLILFLCNSCAYQKMNSVNQKKFFIQEFEVLGDARESFMIQKKIQRFSNKESENKNQDFNRFKKIIEPLKKKYSK